MPITKINLGKYENVPCAEFGIGDIKITKAKMEGDIHQSMIILYSQQAKEIGHEDNDWDGMSTDSLPIPDIVLRFTKPESITALIHSLCELQKEVFKNNQSTI